MLTKRTVGLAALLAAALASCGAPGDGDSLPASSCSATWTCSGQAQCAIVMGGPSGTAGPFADARACEAWRQATILTSVCSCGGDTGGGGGGGGGGSTPPAIASMSLASGTPGTSVTVTGTGFPGATTGLTVSLCGVDATVTSVSSTEVVFTVPTMSATACAVRIAMPSATVTSSTTFAVLPAPVTLAQSAFGAGIAVDSASVYWVEYFGAVKKVGLAGGAVTTLAPTGGGHCIAVDGTSVYYADFGLAGTLRKVPLGGGASEVLASGVVQAEAIAVDSTSVYWVENASPGALKKVGLAGGAVTTLVANLSWPVGVAVDATNVYWSESNGSVSRMGLGDGIVRRMVASGLGSAGPIALDATGVYWATGTGVAMVGKSGSMKVVIATTGLPGYGVAVDGEHVYWLEPALAPPGSTASNGALKKVSVRGGAVTTLASGLASPKSVVVDGSNAYWTEYSGVSPRKIAK